MGFEQVPKPQDGRFIRKTGPCTVETREFAIQRHIIEGLFHRWIRQTEPLLDEVNAQHRRNRKWRTASLPLWIMRLDQLNQPRPRHHSFHLVQKLPLARALG